MAGNDIAIKITAESSQFQRELGKVVGLANQAGSRIGSGFKNAFAGFAAGFGVAAFANLIKGSIDAADRLQDLSKRTGVAVETLGGIGFAAKQSGADLETVAKAFGKFNLRVADAAAGNDELQSAFAKMGITLRQLQTDSPEQLFANLADEFNKYADGPQKAAIANKLFGKSYQDLIPLLDEGGKSLLQNIQYFQKYSGISAELTENADKFNDSVEKMKLLNGAFANALASRLLPSLQGLVDLYVDAKEKGDGFAGTSERIAEGLKVIAKGAAYTISKFINLGDLLGSFAAQAEALSRLDFKAVGAIGDAREEMRKNFAKDLEKVFDAIDGKRTGTDIALPKARKPRAPGLDSPDKNDTARKELDAQIKAFENAIKDEQDILKDREHFLQVYYQDDQIGIRDYFTARQDVIDEALRKELAAYDGELAALKAFAAKANAKDRIDTESKIADIVAKRANVERDAALKGIDLWLEQKKAAAQFADQIDEITLRLAALSGDALTADLGGFDRANRDFKKLAEKQADSTDPAEAQVGRFALSQIASLRAVTEQQLRLNKTQREFGNVLEGISLQQGRIDNEQALGAITELEAINKKSDAARAYIGVLERLASQYEEIARGLPVGAAQDEAILKAQQLRLQIEQLEVSTHALEITFRKTFEDAFASSLTDVITRTKSVKEAFKDMEKSIVASISRIASQNLAEAIFGKSGPGGGVGALFAGLFGGGGGGNATGNIASDVFSFLGFAGGGSPPIGKPSLVGERGPELFVPRTAGVIVPNDVLTSKRSARQNNINISINVPGNISRASADQIAAASGASVQRALARIT